MDKLQPILKQKFWIILGVGLILTFTGWWMATTGLAKTITERQAAIKAAEDGIPSPTSELPNDDWTSKLSQINQRQENMVSLVRRDLWDQQKATMIWPENVADFAAELPYRGDFSLVARNLYRSSYMFAVEDAWRNVVPIDLNGKGMVLFPMEKMPLKKNIVGDVAPSSAEIWDAQEDLWLTVPILQAIREVNGGEQATRLDASIHTIDKLELMGGERTTGESSSSQSGGDGADAMMMGGMMNPAGNSGGGRGNDAGGKAESADFNPEEEFGTSGREGRSGGGGGGAFGMQMSMEMGADGGAGGGGGAEPVAIRRYVDDDEAAPYKTRAFYLSVVMDHRKVPHLIAELTASGNSPWPMEVVRVQMARLNADDTEGRNLGGMMAGGGGISGGVPMGFDGAEAGGAAYAGEASAGIGLPEAGGLGGGVGLPGMQQARPDANTQASLDVAMQDPFMAKVALAGLIYLYRPVTEEAAPTSEPGSEPVAEAPADGAMTTEAAADPAAATDMPADTATPAATDDATAADAPATPATTEPAAESPAAETPAAAPPTPANADPAAAPTTPVPAASPPPADPAAAPPQ